MKIDTVLRNAVAGVEKGLNDARKVSAQLAIGAPSPEEDETEQNKARVEKSGDVELGKIVDVKA